LPLGRFNVVGMAIRYSVDGPEIESQRGREFAHPFSPALWPTQPRVWLISDFFPGVRISAHGPDHPPPRSAEFKESVKLYLYCPSGPSWPLPRWTLPLSFYLYFATPVHLSICAVWFSNPTLIISLTNIVYSVLCDVRIGTEFLCAVPINSSIQRVIDIDKFCRVYMLISIEVLTSFLAYLILRR
jgi:hypothetical protein